MSHKNLMILRYIVSLLHQHEATFDEQKLQAGEPSFKEESIDGCFHFTLFYMRGHGGLSSGGSSDRFSLTFNNENGNYDIVGADRLPLLHQWDRVSLDPNDVTAVSRVIDSPNIHFEASVASIVKYEYVLRMATTATATAFVKHLKQHMYDAPRFKLISRYHLLLIHNKFWLTYRSSGFDEISANFAQESAL